MTRTLVRQSQKRFQVSGDDSIVLMQLDRLGEVSFPDPDLNEAAAAADAPRGLALSLLARGFSNSKWPWAETRPLHLLRLKGRKQRNGGSNGARKALV